MLSDALEHLVQGIVLHPDDVRVRDKELRQGQMLEVRVLREDVGKVIGRQGRIAKEIRTIIKAVSQRDGKRVTVDIVD